MYSTVKQHLIETGEDDKEYEMDDGATEDSNQIYAEMSVSDHRPAGGHEATHHTGLRSTSTIVQPTKTHATSHSPSVAHTASSTATHTNSSHRLTIVLPLIVIAYMLFSLGMPQQRF